ncbi:MAG TPA: class I SAM-dependent methyltransferase [Gaiellaceae bacterium]|nr:class I SAM-dependent methyltransferase [Gaiellaceae bacterium]
MLRSLRKRVTAAPPNTSRIRLRDFARDAAAEGRDKSFRVLDAGAGRARYRHLFDHVSYETCDITDETGVQDYLCDIADLPMPDGTYDLVFCSQTLEHVENPQRVMSELARVTKPGGQVWLSAPLIYEEHNQPHDYFRYTQFAWRLLAEQAGLQVEALRPLEGYYGTLSYHLHTGSRLLPKRHRVVRWLLSYLSRRMARAEMQELLSLPGYTKNYRVQLRKPL